MSRPKRFRPSVTVAAVIEHEGRYLLVQERTPEGLKFNNPAGHLEQGESPQQAVVREALEETARDFTPEALVGVYLSRFQRPARGEDVTYMRLAYSGHVGEPHVGRLLDHGIERVVWMTPEEVRASVAEHRSPLVLRCIEDHLAGRRFALDLVQADASLGAPEIKGPPAAAEATMRAAQDRPARRPRREPRPMNDQNDSSAAVAVPADAAAAPAANLQVDASSQTPTQMQTQAPAPADPAVATDVPPNAEGTLAQGTPADAPPVRPPAAPEPTLAQTAAILAERFPALFTPGRFLPIKLRVQADIQERSPGLFTKKQLSIFLHRHTTSTAYLRVLAQHPTRHDLDGAAAGDVAAEHREAAGVEVERRRQIVEQRRIAERDARRGAGRPDRPDRPPRGPGRFDGAAALPEGGAPAAGEAGGAAAAGVTPAGEHTAPREARPPRGDGAPQGDRPPRRDRPPRQDGRDGRGSPGGPGPRGPRPPGAPGAPGGASMGAPGGDRRGPPGARWNEGGPGGQAGPGGARPPRTDRRPFEGRPQDGRPRDDRPRDDRSRDGRSFEGRSQGGPFGGPPPRRDGGPRGEPEAMRDDPSWDPARRDRAHLLRAWEGSPLTPANFCALKGLKVADFEAQIAKAKSERAERFAPARPPAPSPAPAVLAAKPVAAAQAAAQAPAASGAPDAAAAPQAPAVQSAAEAPPADSAAPSVAPTAAPSVAAAPSEPPAPAAPPA